MPNGPARQAEAPGQSTPFTGTDGGSSAQLRTPKTIRDKMIRRVVGPAGLTRGWRRPPVSLDSVAYRRPSPGRSGPFAGWIQCGKRPSLMR